MSSFHDRSESGVALVVTILLLVLVTAMALGAMETVQRDQQVAGFQNRARLAFYAAEAGVADAKNRLRDVWTDTATVDFPDQVNAVAIGDAASFPNGRPIYYADPDASTGVELIDTGAPSVGGGGDLRLGRSTRVNTLWQIQVVGQAPGGAMSRLDVVATRELSAGY